MYFDYKCKYVKVNNAYSKEKMGSAGALRL